MSRGEIVLGTITQTLPVRTVLADGATIETPAASVANAMHGVGFRVQMELRTPNTPLITQVLNEYAPLTRIEDNNANVKKAGTWTTQTSAHHSGGSRAYSSDINAAIRIKFEGVGIDYVGGLTTSGGYALVILDGRQEAVVDCYGPAANQVTLWQSGRLEYKEHVLEIQPVGDHAPGSSGNNVYVDAFDVYGRVLPADSPLTVTRYEDTNAYLRWVGSWTAGSHASYSGGTAKFTTTAGASCQLLFHGSRITVYGRSADWNGWASIYIDGVQVGIYDTWSAIDTFGQLVYRSPVLSEAEHTLRIDSLGQSRAGANGQRVYIDCFDIRGTLLNINA